MAGRYNPKYNATLYKFYYEGEVKQFEHTIKPIWKGYTIATTPRKALANLSYRIKKELKLEASASITLNPEKLIPMDRVY